MGSVIQATWKFISTCNCYFNIRIDLALAIWLFPGSDWTSNCLYMSDANLYSNYAPFLDKSKIPLSFQWKASTQINKTYNTSLFANLWLQVYSPNWFLTFADDYCWLSIVWIYFGQNLIWLYEMTCMDSAFKLECSFFKLKIGGDQFFDGIFHF